MVSKKRHEAEERIIKVRDSGLVVSVVSETRLVDTPGSVGGTLLVSLYPLMNPASTWSADMTTCHC